MLKDVCKSVSRYEFWQVRVKFSKQKKFWKHKRLEWCRDHLVDPKERWKMRTWIYSQKIGATGAENEHWEGCENVSSASHPWCYMQMCQEEDCRSSSSSRRCCSKTPREAYQLEKLPKPCQRLTNCCQGIGKLRGRELSTKGRTKIWLYIDICVYTYAYNYIYTYIYTYLYNYIHTCTHTHAYI